MAKRKPKIFGSLESEIMRVLWARSDASVRDVAEEMLQSRKIAYTTVMTVMQRLVEKGVLKRRLVAGAYRYRPAADRRHFFQTLCADFLAMVRKDFGEVAVSSFLDEMDRYRKL